METSRKKPGLKFSLVYLLFFISSTTMMVVTVVFSIYINGMERETVHSIQNHLLVAAQRASMYLTIDELKLFYTAEDMERPEWEESRVKLKQFAEDSHVLYVYYWRYVGDGYIQYIIDNDEDEEYMVTPELFFALEDDPFTAEAVEKITAKESWVTDLGEYTTSWDGLLSAAVPVFDADGSVYCAAGVDISDEVLVNMRSNIRLMRFVLVFSLLASIIAGFFGMHSYSKKAIQSEKANISKSRFLSTMSHEMRTPLNAIIGMTMIGKKSNDIDEKNHSFDKIENASSHLYSIINDVLDMAKIEANKLELSFVEYSFEKMIQKVLAVVSFRAEEKQLSLTIDIDSAIPVFIVGDDQHLAQVITNLLSNAIKFTPEGGKIKLTATLVNESDDECELRVEVSDTGIGISPKQQDKLFGMFEQAESGTSRRFGGTGLGLIISKSIVEMMGGKIWVESELDQGACFIFTIKTQKSEKRNDSIGEQPDTNVDQSETVDNMDNRLIGKKMLIAEDIEINSEILMSLLESTGIDIDCVENGEDALSIMTAATEEYDIIFMDLQMPIMDGLEATRRIRTLPSCGKDELPIIAMTANAFKDDIEGCLKAGMNEHLSKPIDIIKVFDVLRKYLLNK